MDAHPRRQNGAGRTDGRMTVLDYFHLGLQRGKHAVALPIIGDAVRGSNGLAAQYQLRVEHDIVHQVSFEASTCVALVAYCELLARWVTGMPLREAVCISAGELADRLEGAPICQRDRAWLAVQAMQNAVLAAVSASAHQKKGGNS